MKASPARTLPLICCTLAMLWLGVSGGAAAQTGMRQIGPADMPVTVLYPTAQANQPLRQGPIEIEVAPDAEPLPGPRRLIVFSHGTAGSAVVDHALAATLVRAGFVVAQPEHRGDNYRDFSQAGPPAWQTRPGEISETIDLVARDNVLGPLVHTDQVGVHGMSAGGVTALALAGAQWSVLELIRHCDRHLREDIGFCLNGLGKRPIQQWLRRAQYAFSGLMPDTFLPAELQVLHGGTEAADPRPDPRVSAVSLLVPLGAIFTAESLARMRIPVGLTVAEADEVLVPGLHSGHILEHCRTCQVLSTHAGAGHFDWLAPWPDDVARAVAALQMRGGLPHANFTDAQRQAGFDQITEYFVGQLQP
ncbi:MAG: alpha/beta hydrolase family protein [Pigmentiphaga sp.]